MVEEFIGRDHELAVLARSRAHALAGRRQVAVIWGEAGIGKTSSCERVTADAERDGFDVVWVGAGRIPARKASNTPVRGSPR